MVNISIRAGYTVNFSMWSRTKGYAQVFSAKWVVVGRRKKFQRVAVLESRQLSRRELYSEKLLDSDVYWGNVSYFLKNKKISARKHNNFKQIPKQLRFWWHWLLFYFLDMYLISIFLLRLGQGCGLKDPQRLLVAISISVAFSRLPDLAVFAEEWAIYFSNYFSVRYRDKMD